MKTTYTPRPKWGIVSIAFLCCAFLVGALFVFRNEKEILALYRHQLTLAELQQIAHYQYQSECDDRLSDIASVSLAFRRVQDQSNQTMRRISDQQLVIETMQQVQDSLHKALTLLSIAYDRSTAIRTLKASETLTRSLNKSYSLVPDSQRIERNISNLKHYASLLKDFKAVLVIDSSGNQNVRYYSEKQKKLQWLFPLTYVLRKK